LIINLIDPENLQNAPEAARYLLGAHIIRTLEDGTVLEAKIVETEAYHQDDPASHTYGGQTKRNEAMFGEAGRAYIYFTYGMHWCFNVTAGPEGRGEGVLIRAAEPLKGIERMKRFRKVKDKIQLANGPAKLAQALTIQHNLYGHNLQLDPLKIVGGGNTSIKDIMLAPRIGISKGVDELMRFYITDSPYVSKK